MLFGVVVSALIDHKVQDLTHYVAVNVFWSVFFSVCFFIWCKVHASENGIENLKYFPLLCAVLGILGIIIYAYAKFGLKRGSQIVLGVVIFSVIAFGLYFFAEYTLFVLSE